MAANALDSALPVEKKPTINPVLTENIPVELRSADCFLRWRYITKSGKKPQKRSVDASGRGKGYAVAKIHLSFDEASDITKDGSFGLGISLKEDGLLLDFEGTDRCLWCLDLDGFVELGGTKCNDEVAGILDRTGSYAEISPSGTGLKVFFVTDKRPEKKSAIKFSPSTFAKKYPEVRKYRNREIEIFSKGFFLTLTGDLCHEDYAEIRYLPEADLDDLLEWLHEKAVETGGTGLPPRLKVVQERNSDGVPATYRKLTPESLDVVLKYVDHTKEQAWTDVAYALARVYGQEGREAYIKYSRGDYAGVEYSDFDLGEVDERFSRALQETKTRPDGFGVTHLIELARDHSKWSPPLLSYEDDQLLPQENLPQDEAGVHAVLEKIESHQVV